MGTRANSEMTEGDIAVANNKKISAGTQANSERMEGGTNKDRGNTKMIPAKFLTRRQTAKDDNAKKKTTTNEDIANQMTEGGTNEARGNSKKDDAMIPAKMANAGKMNSYKVGTHATSERTEGDTNKARGNAKKDDPMIPAKFPAGGRIAKATKANKKTTKKGVDAKTKMPSKITAKSKNQAKGRTKVTTKLRQAAAIEEEFRKYEDHRRLKNVSQKTYRERNKDESKMSPEEIKTAKRDGNRISYQRRKAQLGKIVMVSANDSRLSGAFLLDPIPHGIMIQMLIHCFSDEFNKEYNAGKVSIDLQRNGDNKPVDASGDLVPSTGGADYYMLNWMKSKVSANANLWDNAWENNAVMSVAGVYTLDSFGTMLTASLKEALETEDEFSFHPGFVSTKTAAHQEIHVDSPLAYKVEKDKQNYILHMPLTVEGLSLRIANVDVKVEEVIESAFGKVGTSMDPLEVKKVTVSDFFYHVPFGTALLLPERQWHAGHYGNEGNLRFHAVLRRNMLETSQLLYLDPTLAMSFPKA